MAMETKFAFIPENKGVGDLSSKEMIELKEMLERQNHLLSNKSLINKLKDKGEKIKRVRNEILKEIESRNIITKSLTVVKNNSACEWRDNNNEKSPNKDKIEVETNDKDALTILSENGQIPRNKTHIDRLIEKEKNPNFSFKPFTPVVSEKIKKVVPNAHTDCKVQSVAKTLHLEESLCLLTEQMSALKILGNVSRRRRIEECIQDRINESSEFDNESENQEIIDEIDVKDVVAVNIKLSN